MSLDENDPSIKEAREDVFVSMERYKVKLPVGITLMLQDLTREVVREKPKNIFLFAAELFLRRIQERSEDVGPYGFNSSKDHEFCKYRDKELHDQTSAENKTKARRTIFNRSYGSLPKNKFSVFGEETRADSVKGPRKRSTQRADPCKLVNASRLYAPGLEDDIHSSIFPVQARRITRSSIVSGELESNEKPRRSSARRGTEVADEIVNSDFTRRTLDLQEQSNLVASPPDLPQSQLSRRSTRRSTARYPSIQEESDGVLSRSTSMTPVEAARRATVRSSRVSDIPDIKPSRSESTAPVQTERRATVQAERRSTVRQSMSEDADRRRSRLTSVGSLGADRRSTVRQQSISEATERRESRVSSALPLDGERRSTRYSTTEHQNVRKSTASTVAPLEQQRLSTVQESFSEEPDRRRSTVESTVSYKTGRQSSMPDAADMPRGSRSKSLSLEETQRRSTVRQSRVSGEAEFNRQTSMVSKVTRQSKGGELSISDEPEPSIQSRTTSMVPTSEATVSTQTSMGEADDATQVEPDEEKQKRKKKGNCCLL